MATVALIQGHVFAGGVFFALVHDFRIMSENPRFKFCASEVNLGMELPESVLILCRTVLPAQSMRHIILGSTLKSEEALKIGAITGQFADQADSEKQIQQVAILVFIVHSTSFLENNIGINIC